jgi:hypothetical protein
LTPARLPDGFFDVVVESRDEIGNIARDRTVAEVVIDTTPPVAPTVNAGSAVPITGSWANGDAKSLKVTINEKTYALDSNEVL